MALEGRERRCPQCGAYLEDDARFCSNCGAAVTEAIPPTQAAPARHQRWCPRCGEPVGPDNLFCPSCGTSLAQATPIEDQKTRVLHDTSRRAYQDTVEPDGLLVPPDDVPGAIYDTLDATTVAQQPTRPAPAPAPQPQYAPPYAQSPDPVGYHYEETGADRPTGTLFIVCGIICALCVAVLVVVLVVLPAQRRQAAGGDVASAETTTTQSQGQTSTTDGGVQTGIGSDASTPVTDGTSAEGTQQTMPSTEPAQDEGMPTTTQTETTNQMDTQTKPVSEPEPEPEPELEPEPAGPPSFSDATASSTLQPDQITSYYGPYNAIDGDTHTAWNEGAQGTGAGEWIRLTAAAAQRVHGVSLMGGYAKSEEIYYKNNRPRLVTVSLSDGYSRQIELADDFGVWQAIDFDGEHTTTYVQVTIDSVYEGTTWNDASFTEVSVY